MLKLRLSESAENFRSEFATWLNSHLPPSIGADTSLDKFVEVGRSWQKTLASGNWVGVHWPTQYGGRGLTLAHEAIVQEELVRVSSPQILGLFGISMVGPVISQHGTEAQKERFLRKILNADEIWCQGFSEPGAGSDLAAIKTKALPVDGGFLVTGQKVWTSFAHIADLCFLLCRTSDEPEKHKGLSYLLVDMKSKGITTRALKQISGDNEFNEVFFDEVFVPDSHLVGKVGDGWKIALSTLMYERVVLTFARQLQSETALRELIKRHKNNPDIELRNRLARSLSQACAVRALAYEHLLDYAEGEKPGPEGSLDKLFWSESFQTLSKLALDLGDGTEEDMHRYLYSRGRTIAAGSSEIQRNVIAERILGLPRI